METTKLIKPDYVHREHENDIVKKDDPCPFNEGRRAVLVALPFISLYKPAGFVLTVGMGGSRALVNASRFYTAIQAGSAEEKREMFFQTLISVAGLIGTIFAHPLGMAVATGHDIATASTNLAKHIQAGENREAIESAMDIINNALYLSIFIGGGIQLTIASLAMQVSIELYKCHKAFLKEGHLDHLEAAGHLAMALIRVNQLGDQVNLLRVRQEANRKMNEEQTAAIKKLGGEIDNLKNKLTELQKKGPSRWDGHPRRERRGFHQSAIHKAARSGSADEIRALVKNGADVNLAVKRGIRVTPLQVAMKSGNLEAVKTLLELGAKVDGRARPTQHPNGHHSHARGASLDTARSSS